MGDRKWAMRIIGALIVLAVIMGLTLFAEGVDPFFRHAAEIVLKSADSVLSDSGQKLWDASVITTEESEQAVTEGASTGTATTGSGTSKQDKKAEKNVRKDEKKEQKAVDRTSETVQSTMDSLVYRLAGYLPDWIPGRVYVVTFGILGILVVILWLINRYC